MDECEKKIGAKGQLFIINMINMGHKQQKTSVYSMVRLKMKMWWMIEVWG